MKDKREASDPEIHKDMKESSGSIDYKNVKVLIVDDNFFCSLSVSSQLKQYQIDYHMATDGQEGFDMVKHRFDRDGSTYDLIIMDVYMPICDGFKATRMIREYLREQEDKGLFID